MKRKLFAVGIGLACCIAIILLIWFWKSNKPEPTGPPQKEIVVVPSEPPPTEQTQQEMRPVQPSVPDNFNEPAIEQNPPKKVIEIQDFEVAFPKSSMVIDVAPGDSAGILKEGIILSRGSTKYMLDASGDGAIYKQQGSTLQCLYAASERTWMDSLSEQDGYLYFLMATQLATGLYRIPCTGGTPELVFDQISGYSIWGRTVYASTDDSLLAFSLDAPDQTIILWENTPDIRLGFYRAVSDGIVFVLYSDHLNCLYFQDRNGDRALLGQDDAYYATPQVVDDFFYYFSHRYLPDTVKHELYRINWKTGVKELCYTVPDSPNTYNFVINNDLLYLRYDDMLDTMSTTITVSALNGGNASTIVQYENRSGKYAIEITYLLSFEPSDDYLYFNGYSYTNGYHIITRYPIMGDGVRAQEEILYSGQWYPLEDYKALQGNAATGG